MLHQTGRRHYFVRVVARVREVHHLSVTRCSRVRLLHLLDRHRLHLRLLGRGGGALYLRVVMQLVLVASDARRLLIQLIRVLEEAP